MVSVPENRARRSRTSNVVHLAVARFARAGAPRRDPLFFLAGGPGAAAIDPAVRRFEPMFSAFLGQRELVVVDQRGTGRTEPSLDCPTRNLADCRAMLVRRGIDLSAYTTAENAADINDVRLALGYARIDLLGGSYGTILAQAVMRDFPGAVRSAVLDSAAPLQETVQLDLTAGFERSLQVLFQACRSDASCNRHYPDLEARFLDLVARLTVEPARLGLAGDANGAAREIRISGSQFAYLIWQSLYYTEAIPYLPRVIADTADGNLARLARLIERERETDEMSEGMQHSVECAEMAPFMRPEQLRAAAQAFPPAVRRAALDQFGDVFSRCATWNVPAADPRQKAPLRSDIPVLLLSGAFDPATPPAAVRLTAETLSRHYLFLFPDSGHGVFRTSECARQVITAFLADPGTKPHLPCLDRLAPPAFVLPDDTLSPARNSGVPY
jgi:pimeloyl-ACP methyl ester carboxylesterase